MNDRKVKEACGIFGIAAKESTNVYGKIYYGLFALQHRGQESAGIATSKIDTNNTDNTNKSIKIEIVKDMGIVPEALRNKFIEGNIGIGHVRYSTTGSSSVENSQPIQIKCGEEIFAIAHNGNITNTEEIRQKLKGATFLTTTDSEVIANLITHYYAINKNFLESVKLAMNEIVGSYCLVILYKNNVIAVRDPKGFRPLVIGKNEEGEICIASETCALDAIGFSYIRDVEPGEIFVIECVSKKENHIAFSGFENNAQNQNYSQNDNNKISSLKISSSTYSLLKDKISYCMFEYVYFARADSVINGASIYQIRKDLGKILASESYVDADIVIPVPDSGITAAIGYAEQCIENHKRIGYSEGLMKNRYSGRTFILPNQADREKELCTKLNPIKTEVEGKRIILVDDSIVRGTTIKRIIKILRDKGAKEVHIRVSCPPIKFPCKFGIDMQTAKEFIASDNSVDEIAALIGADSLQYISMEGLVRAIGTKNLCDTCLTGISPVTEKQMKLTDEIK
ncbi:putative amidophosphoribosyltransferase [groundwater metagenome]|uniref:amidophosphoribosyltransferase n=1 Tax=groundwater metagenome TaxID=717931 RepID=A0A098E824_9ZZZZ